jgi:hypothetical protein
MVMIKISRFDELLRRPKLFFILPGGVCGGAGGGLCWELSIEYLI